LDKLDVNNKVIIAGSRIVLDYPRMKDILDASHAHNPMYEVVCGCASGADTLGEWWAIERHIPVSRFPADWKQHGIRAGFIRNKQMAGYADRLVAVWDGTSRGTRHMINTMRSLGKLVQVVDYLAPRLWGVS